MYTAYDILRKCEISHLTKVTKLYILRRQLQLDYSRHQTETICCVAMSYAYSPLPGE